MAALAVSRYFSKQLVEKSFDGADFGDGCRDWLTDCWSFDGAIVLLQMMVKLRLCRSRLLRMGTGPSWSWTLTRELSAAGRRTGNCQI